MKVQNLQHAPFEGIGCICLWLKPRQARAAYTRFFMSDRFPELKALNLVIIPGGQ